MIAGAILGLGVPMGQDLKSNLEDTAFNLDQHSGSMKEFVASVRQTIAHRNSNHAVWGWKFPFVQRYLEHIIDDLRAPHLVCVFRDPVPIALRRTPSEDDISGFLVSRLKAQIRNSEMIDRLRVPCLMVSYEKAAAHPFAFVEELSSFLNLPVPSHASEIVDFMTPGTYKDPNVLTRRLSGPHLLRGEVVAQS